MNDFDKMAMSIEKLLPNKSWTLRWQDEDEVNETMFKKIEWKESYSLTWAEVKAEMDKL